MFAGHMMLERVEGRARTTCNQARKKAIQRSSHRRLSPAAQPSTCSASPRAPLRWQRFKRQSCFRCPITGSTACRRLIQRHCRGVSVLAWPRCRICTPSTSRPRYPQIHNRHLRDHIHILQQPARLFQLLGQRIAVVGMTGKTARAHNQALARTHRNADLDAKFVRAACLALADAFHFRRVQGVEFFCLSLGRSANNRCARSNQTPMRSRTDGSSWSSLRCRSRDTRPRIVRWRRSSLRMRLNWRACAWRPDLRRNAGPCRASLCRSVMPWRLASSTSFCAPPPANGCRWDGRSLFFLHGGIHDHPRQLACVHRLHRVSGVDRMRQQRFHPGFAQTLSPTCQGAGIARQAGLEHHLAGEELPVRIFPANVRRPPRRTGRRRA